MEAIKNGKAILFLGAGASFGAKNKDGSAPPSGNGLRDLLADKFLRGLMRDAPLSKVSEYAKNEASLQAVQKYIADIFSNLVHADFHKLIATFRWHSIFTTNYDLIVEGVYFSSKNPMQELGKIIRDGDEFSEKISNPNIVPFFKLHGCISCVNDEKLPLILASEEYSKHLSGRKRLFEHLAEWAREHPIIFCGYGLDDPNMQQIFFDLGDRSINRPLYLLLKPDLNEFEKRYFSSRRIEPIKATFEEFLKVIDQEIPYDHRQLAILRNPQSSSLQRYIVNGTPSDSLLTYIKHEISHIFSEFSCSDISAQEFYSDNWGFIDNAFDVRRRVADDLILESPLDDSIGVDPRIFVLKGYAGSGKTVTLRRFCWKSSKNHNKLIFWVPPGVRIKNELFAEIYNLTRLIMCFGVLQLEP